MHRGWRYQLNQPGCKAASDSTLKLLTCYLRGIKYFITRQFSIHGNFGQCSFWQNNCYWPHALDDTTKPLGQGFQQDSFSLLCMEFRHITELTCCANISMSIFSRSYSTIFSWCADLITFACFFCRGTGRRGWVRCHWQNIVCYICQSKVCMTWRVVIEIYEWRLNATMRGIVTVSTVASLVSSTIMRVIRRDVSYVPSRVVIH